MGFDAREERTHAREGALGDGRAFMRAELKNRGNELLEEGVKRVESAGGLVAGAHLLEGRAADEILDLAGQIGAGLIVIGSRGG